MKLSHLFGILLTAAFGCFGLVLQSANPSNPIAVLPLEPQQGNIIEEFQITNRSSTKFVVTCRTMSKTKGTWQSESSCVTMWRHVQPHSAFNEHVIVPHHGEGWRLVAAYYQADTLLSRAVDTVRRLLRLPTKARQVVEVLGPEMRKDDA